jgi:hypothetical protein
VPLAAMMIGLLVLDSSQQTSETNNFWILGYDAWTLTEICGK